MRLFDNHCHLGYGKNAEPAADVLERARVAGVVGFVTVGTDAETSAIAIDVAAEHADVWATVGLHPHDAVNGVDSIVDLIVRPKVVAIGECGLDFHYDHSPRDIQRRAFAEQIALAHDHHLPLVIHTREAWDDTFDILRAEGVPSSTIFHCFTGGPAEARRCLDIGGYLSFSGIVSFKGSADNREAAAMCPINKLLSETDSPYLTPAPHRGRRNEPGFVRFVVDALAECRGESPHDVANSTADNAVVAFGLAST